MKTEIAARLITLNHEFYQTFAAQFSATRMRLQPGVMQILEKTPQDARILDLGCGNGEFTRQLIHREFQGKYVGLDFSGELLEVARNGIRGLENFSFLEIDLGNPNWHSAVATHHSPFTMITAFAALHHIPSRALHLQFFNNVYKLLASNGQFIHSNWQFLNSERLRARIQPWNEINLDDSDVDPGDYLLDWRQGGRGLRYVHHFSEEELAVLAKDSGFNVIESFYSDGDGGNLGLYQIWQKTNPDVKSGST